MSDPRPLATWDSDDPIVNGVAWWSRLDDRYQVEVQYAADGDRNTGHLVVFDHDDGNRILLFEQTGIAYGAMFGPDADDVARWQNRAIEVIGG